MQLLCVQMCIYNMYVYKMCIYNIYVLYIHIHTTCMSGTHGILKRVLDPGTEVLDGCDLPYKC